MDQTPATNPRKKILIGALTLLGSLTAFKFLTSRKDKKKEVPEEMITMLSHDGQLVTINKKHLASSTKKVSKEELQQWINKPPHTK